VGVIILAVMLFPIYWMVNVSLQPASTMLEADWFPFTPNLSGYITAFHDQWGHLLTSLFVSLGAVVICLVIATPAAYALAHFKLPGSTAATFAIIVSQMIPAVVVANALYPTYNDTGILDNYIGLMLADASLGLPFSILIIRAFMASVSPSLVEAGYVDGASKLRVFWSIVVPIARNSIITGGLFTFLFAWSDFLLSSTLAGKSVRPVTLGVYQYITSYVTDWSTVMATAVLASLPALVLLVIAQRFIAAGITGGATKA
jgi:multiple sugar transport system permease protein